MAYATVDKDKKPLVMGVRDIPTKSAEDCLDEFIELFSAKIYVKFYIMSYELSFTFKPCSK